MALGTINTERYTTALAERPLDEAVRIEAQLRELHPIGRIGQPEEVAAIVDHLLSGEASFINGAVIPVDGGRSVAAQDPKV